MSVCEAAHIVTLFFTKTYIASALRSTMRHILAQSDLAGLKSRSSVLKNPMRMTSSGRLRKGQVGTPFSLSLVSDV